MRGRVRRGADAAGGHGRGRRGPDRRRGRLRFRHGQQLQPARAAARGGARMTPRKRLAWASAALAGLLAVLAYVVFGVLRGAGLSAWTRNAGHSVGKGRTSVVRGE